MSIDVESSMDGAFADALHRAIQNQADSLISKAFETRAPLRKKLEEIIEQAFQRFIEKGIEWENNPGCEK